MRPEENLTGVFVIPDLNRLRRWNIKSKYKEVYNDEPASAKSTKI